MLGICGKVLSSLNYTSKDRILVQCVEKDISVENESGNEFSEKGNLQFKKSVHFFLLFPCEIGFMARVGNDYFNIEVL